MIYEGAQQISFACQRFMHVLLLGHIPRDGLNGIKVTTMPHGTEQDIQVCCLPSRMRHAQFPGHRPLPSDQFLNNPFDHNTVLRPGKIAKGTSHHGTVGYSEQLCSRSIDGCAMPSQIQGKEKVIGIFPQLLVAPFQGSLLLQLMSNQGSLLTHTLAQ